MAKSDGMHSRVQSKGYGSKPSNLSLVCQLLYLREFNLLKLNTQAGFKVLYYRKRILQCIGWFLRLLIQINQNCQHKTLTLK